MISGDAHRPSSSTPRVSSRRARVLAKRIRTPRSLLTSTGSPTGGTVHIREREREIAQNAESRARAAKRAVTRSERLEAEGKGRRTATDVKVARELLKDDYPR